jgi:hypothetical protein
LNAYQNYPPLPLPAAAGLLIGVLGLAAIIRERKKLFAEPYVQLFSVVVLIYLAALWISGYLQYRHTDVFVLMNGRYLLPVLLLIVAIAIRPVADMLKNTPALKISLGAAIIFCFIEGGGFVTFIMRSDPSWLWPNAAVQHTNNAARDVLRPVIYDSDKTYATPIWFFN